MVAARKRTRRDHVTHHVTHVIDDGGAADGPRKSHIHAKTIKSPVLPYNKWESQPVTAVSAGKVCLSRPDSPLTATHTGGYLGDGTLMLHHHAADSASGLELEVRHSCLAACSSLTGTICQTKSPRPNLLYYDSIKTVQCKSTMVNTNVKQAATAVQVT